MNKYEKKRENIFDTYSENLYHYLKAINLFESDFLNNIRGNYYYCPLCYTPFAKEALVAGRLENHLTLEHNPPGSLGGKSKILTCKKCNNNNGASLDHLAADLLRFEDFIVHDKDGSLKSRIQVEGKTIRAEFIKVNKQIFIKPTKDSNPNSYNLIADKLSKSEQVTGNYDLKMPKWSDYSFAILKSAYLKAFELFGYNYADLGNAKNLRECLSGEKEYPCFNNGVIDFFAPDDMVGLSIIREPKELQAIIIVQKFTFKTENGFGTKNVPVVLPAPIEGGWDRLSNFKSYRDQNINWQTEKIRIMNPPLNDIHELHKIFYGG